MGTSPKADKAYTHIIFHSPTANSRGLTIFDQPMSCDSEVKKVHAPSQSPDDWCQTYQFAKPFGDGRFNNAKLTAEALEKIAPGLHPHRPIILISMAGMELSAARMLANGVSSFRLGQHLEGTDVPATLTDNRRGEHKVVIYDAKGDSGSASVDVEFVPPLPPDLYSGALELIKTLHPNFTT
jgi:hypothetical protein